ncbi:MAG TPA: ROK family protein [Gaiellales bacterium]|jgi:glucokinase|nr:ROK family protein [Gaiellales bacterium]
MGVRGGIDLGGTKIQAVVVGDDNDVRGQARLPTPKDGGPDGVIAAMAGAVRTAAQEAKVETSALAGVGIGSPGEVDPDAGTITNAYNVVPDWNRTIEVGGILAQDLGTRIGLGNDVRVATTAEFELGAGKPYRSILGVFWGTGVGGGIILDGRPWQGRGAAGEIGHMVVRRNGARCTCGRDGCMEAYSGRRAMELEARRRMKHGEKTHLFKIMERKNRTALTSGVWAEALEHHDDLATDLIDRAVAALGAGIASAVNLLDVEAVVIGGGLGTRLGQPYVARIEKEMSPHLFVDARPPAVHVAELGDLGGAIGASLLVKAE